jgi:ABC-type Zn2+ transport system substrate-binding protein/surface adhesin
MFWAFGTVFYCVVGGYIMQNSSNKVLFFVLPMITGFCMFVTAFVYSDKSMDHDDVSAVEKEEMKIKETYGAHDDAEEEHHEEHDDEHGHHDDMSLG